MDIRNIFISQKSNANSAADIKNLLITRAKEIFGVQPDIKMSDLKFNCAGLKDAKVLVVLPGGKADEMTPAVTESMKTIKEQLPLHNIITICAGTMLSVKTAYINELLYKFKSNPINPIYDVKRSNDLNKHTLGICDKFSAMGPFYPIDGYHKNDVDKTVETAPYPVDVKFRSGKTLKVIYARSPCLSEDKDAKQHHFEVVAKYVNPLKYDIPTAAGKQTHQVNAPAAIICRRATEEHGAAFMMGPHAEACIKDSALLKQFGLLNNTKLDEKDYAQLLKEQSELGTEIVSEMKYAFNTCLRAHL